MARALALIGLLMLGGCDGAAPGETDASVAMGGAGSGGATTLACASGPGFTPDRGCATDADCVVVTHQIDCCGSQAALGVNSSSRALFDAREATCRQGWPACPCAAVANRIVTDD